MIVALIVSIPLVINNLFLKNTKQILVKKIFNYAYIISVSVLANIIMIIIFKKIELNIDFKRYFDVAKEMASSGLMNNAGVLSIYNELNTYNLIIPHVIGVPVVYALIFKVFGSSLIVAQLFNTLCMTVSAILIYMILKRITKDNLVSLTLSLVYILWPGIILYTPIVMAEQFAQMLIFIFMYLYIVFDEAKTKKSIIIISLILGVLLSITQFVRGIGPIIIIASVIYTIIKMIGKRKDNEENDKNRSNIFNYKNKYIILIMIIIAIYFVLGKMFLGLQENILDTKFDSKSYAWNLYVGLSEESSGRWNEKDYIKLKEIISQSNQKSELINSRLIELSKDRFNDMGLKGYVNLHVKKFITLMCSDNGPAIAIEPMLKGNDKEAIYKFIGAINIYYYAVYICVFGYVVINIYKRVRHKKDGPIDNDIMLFVTLMFMGMIAIHMLTEVQPRYHYIMNGLIILILGNNIVRTKKDIDI